MHLPMELPRLSPRTVKIARSDSQSKYWPRRRAKGTKRERADKAFAAYRLFSFKRPQVGGATPAAYLMAAYSAVPLPLKARPNTTSTDRTVRDRKIIWVGHNPRGCTSPPDTVVGELKRRHARTLHIRNRATRWYGDAQSRQVSVPRIPHLSGFRPETPGEIQNFRVYAVIISNKLFFLYFTCRSPGRWID